MKYYLYKITCLVSNKYYIGMHSTSNLSDGYFGSGKILKYSIKKYGKENHIFDIIEFLPDIISLKLREREVVNEDILKDYLCMNIQVGGGGGFTSEEHASKARTSGGLRSIDNNRLIHFSKLKNDLEYRGRWIESLSVSHLGEKNGFYGKKHNPEVISEMKISRKGKGIGFENSQFDTCWVSNELKTIKIKKEELETYLLRGWIRGRIKK